MRTAVGAANRGKAPHPAQRTADPITASRKQLDSVVPPEQIELELRLFYHRIPPEFLKVGTPDLSRVLTFKTAELLGLMAQGKITIPLSKITEQMPDLFSVAISAENDVEVIFPWKKVANLVVVPEPLKRGPGPEKKPAEPSMEDAPASGKRLVGNPNSPFTRPWANRTKEVGSALPPPHLREPGSGEGNQGEQKRAALHARKKAWFKGSGTGEAASKASEENPSSEEELRKEIAALRAELAQTRKERDEALAALGLSEGKP